MKRITEAIEKIWPWLPEEFDGNKLINHVYMHTEELHVYSDTIFRTMRQMRADGVINYRCVNKEKSKYQKL